MCAGLPRAVRTFAKHLLCSKYMNSFKEALLSRKHTLLEAFNVLTERAAWHSTPTVRQVQ